MPAGRRLTTYAAAALLAVALLAAGLGGAPGATGQAAGEDLSGADLPRVPRIKHLFDGAAGTHRSIASYGSVVVPSAAGETEPGRCHQEAFESPDIVEGWYGAGGDYPEDPYLLLRVHRYGSAREAAAMLDTATAEVTSCLGLTEQEEGMRVRTALVATPERIGRDRLGYRAAGGFWGRTVFVLVRVRDRILEVEVDSDVPRQTERTWRYKRTRAIATMEILRETARPDRSR